MSKIVWDQEGQRLYETGTSHGVLFPKNTGSSGNTYDKGVPWNGLQNVTESPSGAEETKLFANNQKYLSMYSAEEFGGTIGAYTYPDEFMECDGTAEIATGSGIYAGQQVRKQFGLAYRTIIGNDVAGENFAYKLHLIYNATASPSEKGYSTVNDSPEAVSLSWTFTTTPVNVNANLKPTSNLVIDSRNVPAEFLTYLENKLYGTDGTGGNTGTDPYLPSPAEIIAWFEDTTLWD